MTIEAIAMGLVVGMAVFLERTKRNTADEKRKNKQSSEQDQNNNMDFEHKATKEKKRKEFDSREFQVTYGYEKIIAVEDFITEFQYRAIGEERCEEINNWGIRDPYGYGKFFTAERTRFVTNGDESVLFCRAFRARHDIIDLGITSCTYILIIDKSYYIINFVVKDIITYTDKHQLYFVDILEQEYINENRNELLDILKKVISVYIKKNRREWADENFEYLFYYKGEEI